MMTAALQQLASARQYLTFNLGDEEYGVVLSTVQEVVNYQAVQRVPGTPAWIRGVFNLRGRVLPLVDLRVRLGEPSSPVTSKTCILILHVIIDGLEVPMGVVADYVREVLDLRDDEIEASPVFGTKVRVEYLIGLHKREAGVLCLLDIVKVFSNEELLAVALADERVARSAEDKRAHAISRPLDGGPLDVAPGDVEASDDGGLHMFGDDPEGSETDGLHLFAEEDEGAHLQGEGPST